jgi:hypothetical protein
MFPGSTGSAGKTFLKTAAGVTKDFHFSVTNLGSVEQFVGKKHRKLGMS